MSKSGYFSIASGSSGNSGLFFYDENIILIDMGISVRKLCNALKKINISIEMIDAVLITHEHIDHIRGISTFVKKYSTPIYMTNGTAKEVLKKIDFSKNNINTFAGGEQFKIKDINIISFLTPHDANESVGYIFSYKNFNFGYVTDIGFIPNNIEKNLCNCDFVVLEANHDIEMVKKSNYPNTTKKRVLGNYGHLSNISCANCVLKLVFGKTKTILLAHLSENNNTPFLAMKTVNEMLYNFKKNCEIFVCPSCEMDEPIFFK